VPGPGEKASRNTKKGLKLMCVCPRVFGRGTGLANENASSHLALKSPCHKALKSCREQVGEELVPNLTSSKKDSEGGREGAELLVVPENTKNPSAEVLKFGDCHKAGKEKINPTVPRTNPGNRAI